MAAGKAARAAVKVEVSQPYCSRHKPLLHYYCMLSLAISPYYYCMISLHSYIYLFESLSSVHPASRPSELVVPL